MTKTISTLTEAVHKTIGLDLPITIMASLICDRHLPKTVHIARVAMIAFAAHTLKDATNKYMGHEFVGSPVAISLKYAQTDQNPLVGLGNGLGYAVADYLQLYKGPHFGTYIVALEGMDAVLQTGSLFKGAVMGPVASASYTFVYETTGPIFAYLEDMLQPGDDLPVTNTGEL
jgi:hypothetical protein